MPLTTGTLLELFKFLTGLNKLLPDAKPKENLPWLIVDDSRPEGELYAYVMERLGIKVTLASGPAEARGALKQQKFGGVILDFTFPGEEHGIKFAEDVRKIQPGTPVFFLTGDASVMTQHMAKAGVYVLMLKSDNPLNLDKAFHIITQMAVGLNGEVKPKDVFQLTLLMWLIAVAIGYFLKDLLNFINP